MVVLEHVHNVHGPDYRIQNMRGAKIYLPEEEDLGTIRFGSRKSRVGNMGPANIIDIGQYQRRKIWDRGLCIFTLSRPFDHKKCDRNLPVVRMKIFWGDEK